MRSLLPILLLLLLTGCAGDGGDGAAAGDEPAAEPGGEPSAAAAAEPAATATSESPKDPAELDLPSDGAGAPADPEDAAAPEDGDVGPPPTEGLPGGRYVRITDITAEGQGYAVAFEAFNFVPLIGQGPTDFHVHFFWDTTEPQNAGSNGPDPGAWELYDGPSPFTGYSFDERPPEATQLCALVADSSHGVTVGSGTCMTLP